MAAAVAILARSKGSAIAAASNSNGCLGSRTNGYLAGASMDSAWAGRSNQSLHHWQRSPCECLKLNVSGECVVPSPAASRVTVFPVPRL